MLVGNEPVKLVNSWVVDKGKPLLVYGAPAIIPGKNRRRAPDGRASVPQRGPRPHQNPDISSHWDTSSVGEAPGEATEKNKNRLILQDNSSAETALQGVSDLRVWDLPVRLMHSGAGDRPGRLLVERRQQRTAIPPL